MQKNPKTIKIMKLLVQIFNLLWQQFGILNHILSHFWLENDKYW